LESLQAYNGSVGLHRYAEKFVYGEMYKGVNALAIMKPLSLSQAKRGIRLPKPRLVSYDEYWMFDKLNENTIANRTPPNVENIREIMESSPGEYRRLFYSRYDYDTLSIIHSIAYICELEAYSEETFRKKMKIVMQYISDRLAMEYSRYI
jgi:hypothetical protein